MTIGSLSSVSGSSHDGSPLQRPEGNVTEEVMSMDKMTCVDCGKETTDDDILVISVRKGDRMLVEMIRLCPECRKEWLQGYGDEWKIEGAKVTLWAPSE